MPRSVDDILRHADELARRFEEYDPAPERERSSPVEESLRQAVAERLVAERHLVDAVQAARRSGLSWATIGRTVGTSGEAARQRYAKLCA